MGLIFSRKGNITIKGKGQHMRPLQMIKVIDYDYNNSGQFLTYYKRPKPDVMDFWNGKEFHEWEIELLQSEGYKLMIIKTIELHAD